MALVLEEIEEEAPDHAAELPENGLGESNGQDPYTDGLLLRKKPGKTGDLPEIAGSIESAEAVAPPQPFELASPPATVHPGSSQETFSGSGYTSFDPGSRRQPEVPTDTEKPNTPPAPWIRRTLLRLVKASTTITSLFRR